MTARLAHNLMAARRAQGVILPRSLASSLQTGLEMKDLWNLKDLTIHDAPQGTRGDPDIAASGQIV